MESGMKLEHDSFADLKLADSKGRVLLGRRYAGKRFAMREEQDGTAVLTPVTVIAGSETEGIITARRLADRFAALERLGDNWDGRGSPAPTPEIVLYSREIVGLLQASALSRNLPWFEPHIGSNERGQISLEWWNGNRSLTLIVRSTEQIDYLKTWGSHILNEMEDGEVSRIVDFISLSHWLNCESR
jgi:hypothetical protein